MAATAHLDLVGNVEPSPPPRRAIGYASLMSLLLSRFVVLIARRQSLAFGVKEEDGP